MGSIITIVTTLLGVIPQIIDIVKAIEVPGNGADKAATVTGLVFNGLHRLPHPDVVSKLGDNKVTEFIVKAINTVVGFLNKVGFFPKTSDASCRLSISFKRIRHREQHRGLCRRFRALGWYTV